MLIAVTGATGFIGRYLTRRLLADGCSVRVLARPGRASALGLDDAPGREHLLVHEGDLTDAGSLRGFLDGATHLVHLASAHDHYSEEVMKEVNITGTEHLVAEAERVAPECMVVLVSSAVIGVPVYGYYRDSKRVQEKVVRGSKLPWASFRPTLVYGRDDHRHTAPLLRKCGAKKGTYWVYHEGLSKLNPVHVDDMVDAIVKLFAYARAREEYRVFEIAGPYGIPFNEFIDLTIAATGGGVKRRNIPRRWVERAILLKGLFKDVTKERRGAGYFSLHHDHDIRPAQEELGFAPRTFAEGIKDVAAGDWWREERSETGQVSRLGT
jgi:nucleoside-diphosphate-sugar epimerase